MARALPFVAAAMCLLAPTVRADEPRRPPPPAEQQKPLSAEDAEVVKQLTLLEQVDLLRNLDLFAPGPTDAQPGTEPADAGTR
jgi:hypothetical protein